MAALVLVGALGPIAFLFWDAEETYRRESGDAIARTEREAQQLASLAAAQTDALLRSIDAILLRTRRDRLLERKGFEAATAGHAELLPDGGILALSVVSPGGEVLFSTLPLSGRVSIADRPHFTAHLDGDDRLFVGVPVFGRVSRRWAVQFTRPILDQGRLAGVLAATVSADYLSAGLRRAQLTPDDTLAIFDPGGAYLARATRLEEVLGKTISDRPFLGPNAPERGAVRLQARLDGADRMFAWHRTTLAPTVVVVGLDLKSRLGRVEARRTAHRQEATAASLVVGALAAAALAALFVIARNQRRLRSSEQRFQDFAHASGDWFWETDAEGRITWMSDGVQKAVGVAPEWHYGKRRVDLLAPSQDAESPAWRSHLDALAANRPFRDFRYLRRGPNGDQWLSTSGVPFHDTDGRFLGYRGTGSDVSKLVLAEDSARKADERLRDAIETLEENVIVTDASDRIVILNAAARAANAGLSDRAIGMEYEQFLREGIALGFYPESRGHEAGWLAQRMSQRRTGNQAQVIRRQEGLWYRVSDRRLRDGGVVTVALDITALREANESLRTSLAAFETLLRNISGAAYRCRNDRDWTLDYISDGCVDITGYQANELIGNRVHSLGSLVHPEDAEPLWESCQRSLAAREACRNEYRIIHRDGSERWVWDQAQGIHDEHGNLVAIEGLLNDITKRKHLELALIELNEQLERRVDERTVELRAALREQESFSYTVSHDLRAPLRAINGFAAILLEDHGAALPAEARELLDRVSDNAIRMGELVDGVLELSRLGRAEVSFVAVDMQALVGGVIRQLVGPDVDAGAIRVGDLPAAKGDPVLLRQIWQNLIGNAIKFTSARPDRLIEIGFERDAYFVKDNGAGFSMDYADKLFHLFQRLHGANEFSGAGVGLAIVKRAIERQHGEIWAESTPGHGATFRFTLPGANRGA